MAIVLAGCGQAEKEAEFAHAAGIVKINGTPAPDILVQFLPVVSKGDPGPTSAGVTNESGEYLLETSDGKLGAVIGPCKVLFIDTKEERVPQGVAPKPSRISSEWALVGKATPEVDIKPENESFDFDLKH